MTRAVPSMPAAQQERHPPVLDRLLFYVLLAVLCTRPLLGETFEYLQVSFVTALQAGPGPTPATTAILDTVLLAAAALTLARRGRWRASPWIAAAVVLLAVAVGLSSRVAGDKRVALLAGSSLVITVLAAAALVRLARTRWMQNLLLAGLLATGVTTAIKCLSQRWYENPLTQQRWETVYKPELIRQGFDPDDPLFVNFERRMHAGEAYGFLSHPNVTATVLVMWLMVTGGLLAACVASMIAARRASAPLRAGPLVIAAVACALLAVALPLTGSVGALLAAGFGGVLLIALGIAAQRVARRARTVLAALVVGYLALIAAGLAYGLKNDTLPHPSLAFRWQYWTAAWRAWQDVPLTGLGRENFGPAYLQYKRAESPEEVRNPHDLWLSLLVELGPLGLLSGALLCGASVLAALRSSLPARAETGGGSSGLPRPRKEGTAGGTSAFPLPRREGAGGGFDSKVVTAFQALPLALGVLLTHAAFSGTPFGEPGVWLVWGQEIALAWLLALLLCIPLLNGLEYDVPRARWLGAGLCAALAAALLHSLIDFTLLTPAGAGVFALIAASAATLGRDDAPSASAHAGPVARLSAAGVAVAAMVFHITCVAWPVTTDAQALSALENAGRGGPAAVRAAVLRVTQTKSVSPAVARAAARACLRLGSSPNLDPAERLEFLTQAQAYADRTCQIDPRDAANYALAAAVAGDLAAQQQAAGQVTEAAQNERRAAENWQRAIARYPTGIDYRLAAGAAWMAVWERTRDDDARRQAVGNFQAALAIDAARPPNEVVRLRPAQRRRAMDALAVLTPSTTSSRPGADGS